MQEAPDALVVPVASSSAEAGQLPHAEEGRRPHVDADAERGAGDNCQQRPPWP